MAGADASQTWNYWPQKIEKSQFKIQDLEFPDLRHFNPLVNLIYRHLNSPVSFSVSCLYTSAGVSLLTIRD